MTLQQFKGYVVKVYDPLEAPTKTVRVLLLDTNGLLHELLIIDNTRLLRALEARGMPVESPSFYDSSVYEQLVDGARQQEGGRHIVAIDAKFHIVINMREMD